MRMDALLDAQRAAFMAELPVTIASRKDRLTRAAAMIRDCQGILILQRNQVEGLALSVGLGVDSNANALAKGNEHACEY